MYEYRCKVLKIVDGDTVDVDIDLGFGIVLKNERVRVMGIDTPESRTRDKVEKQFGLAAKKRLKEMLDILYVFYFLVKKYKLPISLQMFLKTFQTDVMHFHIPVIQVSLTTAILKPHWRFYFV